MALFFSILIAVAASAYYFVGLHLRHARYDTYAFDLGLLAQVGWNTWQGRWFETSLLPFNYLAEHFAPSLVALAPLWLVWPDPEALLLVQALAVGAAGIGIFWMARQRTVDDWTALLLQAGLSLAPATGWVARDEFHPITLAMPALTFGTALLWRRRFGAAALVSGLALLANEDAALVVAPFGLLTALVARGRARWWGLGLTVLAVGWVSAYLFLLVPVFRPPDLAAQLAHPDLRAFSQCGTALPDILRCLADPSATWARVTTPADRDAVLGILAPTLGLGLLGPSFLVVLPRWLLLLAGNDPPPAQLHYVALLATSAYLAATEATGWLQRRQGRWPARGAAALVVGASAIGSLMGGMLPGGGAYRPPTPDQERRTEIIQRAVDLGRAYPEATLAATSSIVPHLALRRWVTLPLDNRCPDPELRIHDLRDIYGVPERALRTKVEMLLADPGYQALLNQDDVVVLRRTGPQPEIPRSDLFGGTIRLEGARIEQEGDDVAVWLFWRKEAQVAEDYHLFIHLVDREGRIFSQRDGLLANGDLPTIVWSQSCPVAERSVLAAPPRQEWARYSLAVGWYDLETGQRLRLPDGMDSLQLPLP